MKVLIISDTHGRCTNLEHVLVKLKPIDLLIHLGDIDRDKEYIESLVQCPVEAVSGNNDYLSRDPREKIIKLGHHVVFMTHGHRYGISYGTDKLVDAALEHGADIAMFGHTHVPMIDYSRACTLINPGSISYPRHSSGYSYIVADIDAEGTAHFTLLTV